MAQNQGTGYTNLQSYLNANKGNQLGGALSSDIQGVENNANNQLNSQVGQFQQGLQGATNNLTSTYNAANQDVNTLANNPTSFNPTDLSQVQGYQNAQYSGPSGLSNTAALNAQAQNVQGLGQLAGSQGGRAQLLGEFIGSGNPQYTQAASNLDSLFLGNNIDSQLQGSRNAANQYANNVGQQEQAAQFAAGAAQGALGQQQQQVNTNLGNIGTTLNNVLSSRLNAANAQDTAFNNALANTNNQGLQTLVSQGYNVPTAALNNEAEYNYLGGGNNYFNTLTQGSTAGQNANLAGVATTKDRAQAAALAQLLNNPAYNAEATGPAYIAPTLSVNTGGAQNVLNTALLGANLATLVNSANPNASTFQPLYSSLQQPGYTTPGAGTNSGPLNNGLFGSTTPGITSTTLNPNSYTLQQALNLSNPGTNPFSIFGSTAPAASAAQAAAISNMQAYLGSNGAPAVTSSGNSNLPGYTQALPVSPANATVVNPAPTAPTALPTNFNPKLTQNYTDPNTGANWIYNASTQTWSQNTANPGF